MNSGRRYCRFYVPARTYMSDKKVNAGSFSKPSSGSLVVAHNGGCFPESTVTGTPSINASLAGQGKAFSSNFIIHSQAMQTWSTCSLTQPLFALIHAPPVLKKSHGSGECQALGRSRGGFSTKIHIAVDALGNPLRLILTAGQCHDSPQAVALIDDFEPRALIADKGYDSDALIEAVTTKGIEAVIPPKKNRIKPRAYDRHLYRERHLIECFINKIKHFRRIFSRFEKLSKNYLGFLSFVSALVWLR